MVSVCPSRRASVLIRRITEHDGTVLLLDSCLHGNAESGDNLEASRRPLEFAEAQDNVEETEKQDGLESIWSNRLAVCERVICSLQPHCFKIQNKNAKKHQARFSSSNSWGTLKQRKEKLNKLESC